MSEISEPQWFHFPEGVLGWRSEPENVLQLGPGRVDRAAQCVAHLVRHTGVKHPCTSSPNPTCTCGIWLLPCRDHVAYLVDTLRARGPVYPHFGPRSAIISVRGLGKILPGGMPPLGTGSVFGFDPPGTIRVERIEGVSTDAFLIRDYADPDLEDQLIRWGWTVHWMDSPEIVVPAEWQRPPTMDGLRVG